MEKAKRRVQDALAVLRAAFPGMGHTALEQAKIRHNRDAGKAVLEAYSRALEGRAARVLDRLESVVAADKAARRRG